MKQKWILFFMLLVSFETFLYGHPANSADDVVINEINYNPADDAATEFVELYNPTDRIIDLGTYSFTEGIYYSFPANTQMQPGGYLIVVRYTTPNAWKNKTYPILGPYIGDLADGGELLRLRSSDGRIVDEVQYNDIFPWARGADGYGRTLERISPDLPASDSHSWRSSLQVGQLNQSAGGTPGSQNSVISIPPKPSVVSWSTDPTHPTSKDPIHVDITLDGSDLISDVTLRIETIQVSTVSAVQSFSMVLLQSNGDQATYRTTLPAYASQTLVRMAITIQLTNGSSLRLPESTEPRPFESFFVYDGDIPSKLPIMWIYSNLTTKLPPASMTVAGVVIKPVTLDHVEMHDGSIVEGSRNGQKIRFLKHEEYNDNRTLNLLPEVPSGGTTSGGQAPHVEDLSHQIFRDFGVMAPECFWFRVIERGKHTQRILIQQPNEKFLEINGRDSSGDIYKIAYNVDNGYTKMTNAYNGEDDYPQLLSAINNGSESQRRTAIYRYLDVEKVMSYSVAGVLMSNWDGFFNNMFLYHDPGLDMWECIPWDLDKTFGYTDNDPMFVAMPINYPLDGQAPKESRSPGPISRPFHKIPELHERYIYQLRDALDGLFAKERIQGMMQEIEDLLLADSKLQEQYTSLSTSSRQKQITNAYDTMNTFMTLRHEFLRGVLPVGVSDWSLY